MKPLPDRPLSPWWRYLGFPLVRSAAWLLLMVLGPVRARGGYRVPKTGGVLILPNHISDADPVALQVGCRRLIRFMGKRDLFEIPVLRQVMLAGGVFPVNPGEPDRGALRKAVDLLKAGEAVCIFAEGQISESGELLDLKAGVALVARLAGCPVVCCGIRGTSRIIPYGSVIPRPGFARVDVNWGETRTFEKDVDAKDILEWVRSQLIGLTEE